MMCLTARDAAGATVRGDDEVDSDRLWDSADGVSSFRPHATLARSRAGRPEPAPRRPAPRREASMRVGYFTMPLHPPGADPGRTMADDLEQLVFLDRLGFEEAWVGEHITAEWENIPCPDIFIAQALGMTR